MSHMRTHDINHANPTPSGWFGVVVSLFFILLLSTFVSAEWNNHGGTTNHTRQAPDAIARPPDDQRFIVACKDIRKNQSIAGEPLISELMGNNNSFIVVPVLDKSTASNLSYHYFYNLNFTGLHNCGLHNQFSTTNSIYSGSNRSNYGFRNWQPAIITNTTMHKLVYPAYTLGAGTTLGNVSIQIVTLGNGLSGYGIDSPNLTMNMTDEIVLLNTTPVNGVDASSGTIECIDSTRCVFFSHSIPAMCAFNINTKEHACAFVAPRGNTTGYYDFVSAYRIPTTSRVLLRDAGGGLYRAYALWTNGTLQNASDSNGNLVLQAFSIDFTSTLTISQLSTFGTNSYKNLITDIGGREYAILTTTPILFSVPNMSDQIIIAYTELCLKGRCKEGLPTAANLTLNRIRAVYGETGEDTLNYTTMPACGAEYWNLTMNPQQYYSRIGQGHLITRSDATKQLNETWLCYYMQTPDGKNHTFSVENGDSCNSGDISNIAGVQCYDITPDRSVYDSLGIVLPPSADQTRWKYTTLNSSLFNVSTDLGSIVHVPPSLFNRLRNWFFYFTGLSNTVIAQLFPLNLGNTRTQDAQLGSLEANGARFSPFSLKPRDFLNWNETQQGAWAAMTEPNPHEVRFTNGNQEVIIHRPNTTTWFWGGEFQSPYDEWTLAQYTLRTLRKQNDIPYDCYTINENQTEGYAEDRPEWSINPLTDDIANGFKQSTRPYRCNTDRTTRTFTNGVTNSTHSTVATDYPIYPTYPLYVNYINGKQSPADQNTYTLTAILDFPSNHTPVQISSFDYDTDVYNTCNNTAIAFRFHQGIKTVGGSWYITARCDEDDYRYGSASTTTQANITCTYNSTGVRQATFWVNDYFTTFNDSTREVIPINITVASDCATKGIGGTNVTNQTTNIMPNFGVIKRSARGYACTTEPVLFEVYNYTNPEASDSLKACAICGAGVRHTNYGEEALPTPAPVCGEYVKNGTMPLRTNCTFETDGAYNVTLFIQDNAHRNVTTRSKTWKYIVYSSETAGDAPCQFAHSLDVNATDDLRPSTISLPSWGSQIRAGLAEVGLSSEGSRFLFLMVALLIIIGLLWHAQAPSIAYATSASVLLIGGAIIGLIQWLWLIIPIFFAVIYVVFRAVSKLGGAGDAE